MAEENKKFLFALSLCKKAGKVIAGAGMTVEAIRKGSPVFLVVLASDASENTKKRIADKTAYYGKKSVSADVDGFAVAKAIGKDGAVCVVAITDENLATLILESL